MAYTAHQTAWPWLAMSRADQKNWADQRKNRNPTSNRSEQSVRAINNRHRYNWIASTSLPQSIAIATYQNNADRVIFLESKYFEIMVVASSQLTAIPGAS
jgi:hypothetical protein